MCSRQVIRSRVWIRFSCRIPDTVSDLEAVLCVKARTISIPTVWFSASRYDNLSQLHQQTNPGETVQGWTCNSGKADTKDPELWLVERLRLYVMTFLADLEGKAGVCAQTRINIHELPCSATHTHTHTDSLICWLGEHDAACSSRFPVVFPIICVKHRKYRSNSRCALDYRTNHTLLSTCQDQTV